jgi:hypothetical protein
MEQRLIATYDHRDTYLSGTTTSPTLFGVASSLNSRSGAVSACRRIPPGDGFPCPIG